MRAWESAQWFTEWLELARIEMEHGVEEDLQMADAISDTDAMHAFGAAQLNGAEEHKLAA